MQQINPGKELTGIDLLFFLAVPFIHRINFNEYFVILPRYDY